MSKMQLVLLEQDAYFIDMFSTYVRSSEQAERFAMTVFTSKEQGFEFINRSRETYILLAHESFMPLPERAFQHGCLIILSETPVSIDMLEYPVLCKFQPLNQLLSHVVSHFNEYTSSRMLTGNRKSEVIAVYSAVGGCGKTLTAAHLARELAYQGKRVFYLSFEQLPSAAWMEPSAAADENYFSRMLYYGKTDARVQTAKVELYKRRHGIMGFDYFPGVSEPTEMDEMTAEDTNSLIQAVLATGGYDTVMLDLESSLHPRVTTALRLSDHVLWLAVDDRIHLDKTRMRLKQMTAVSQDQEMIHKMQFIINKYSGSMSNAADSLPLPVSGFLPYIPEWKTFSSVESLQVRGEFSESLAALFRISVSAAEADNLVVG
ncbi:AAA family ATPase [Paenibacillus xerothermodurans]|uniref:ParA family protein n=1 Tax=Paenibacillus xerothermodurans TaxID=1977292 RepID=A0A2W1P3X3_PAEXE|nr:AAA family ATPase [Paenibacillus xerothermodurans]PZE21818.1 ParA family protein [Paenibacillus xerothermodurans]